MNDTHEITREKYWHNKTLEMARVANWFYQFVNESKMSEDDQDISREMFAKMIEFLEPELD